MKRLTTCLKNIVNNRNDMKHIKTLILLALPLLLLGFNHSNIPNDYATTLSESLECKYSQCQAIAKSTGNQCKHCVSNKGDLYCWQHD